MSCKQFCQWTKCPEAENFRKKLFTHLAFSPLLAVQCPSCLSICKQSFPTDNLKNLLEIFRPVYINFFPYMREQQAHGNELMAHLSVGRKHLVHTFISLQHNSFIYKNKMLWHSLRVYYPLGLSSLFNEEIKMATLPRGAMCSMRDIFYGINSRNSSTMQ